MNDIQTFFSVLCLAVVEIWQELAWILLGWNKNIWMLYSPELHPAAVLQCHWFLNIIAGLISRCQSTWTWWGTPWRGWSPGTTMSELPGTSWREREYFPSCLFPILSGWKRTTRPAWEPMIQSVDIFQETGETGLEITEDKPCSSVDTLKTVCK